MPSVNPTGVVFKEAEVRDPAGLAHEHNLFLIVDEVYHKLLFGDTTHFSVCQVNNIRDRAIMLNSFSKKYAMTGWRVGCLVADESVVK